MLKLRTGTPAPEKWRADQLAEHLKIDIKMAKKYFEDYHRANGGGYGPIEKELILAYVNEKQREEREREARHQSDLANVESITYLKDQVKIAKASAVIANAIALGALIVALVSLLIKVG